MMAAIGSRIETLISNPGLPGTLTEAVEANTIAMHDPAPISAAREAIPTTNFGRMKKVPLSDFYLRDRRELGQKNAAKNTTGLKGARPQICKLTFTKQFYPETGITYQKC
jgi:hypothetical protein